jgi:hypothetical protein
MVRAEFKKLDAVAFRESDGWRLCAVDTPAKEGRLVGHVWANPNYVQYALEQCAWRQGWSHLPESDLWLPMEEPYPLWPAESVETDAVELALTDIAVDDLFWTLKVAGKSLSGRVYCPDDDVGTWFKFVKILEDGGEPHAMLSLFEGGTHFTVRQTARSERCRLVVNQNADGAIDAIVPRRSLIGAFRDLFSAAADHPLFAYDWLSCGPEETRDALYDQAESEWADGVRTGLYEDDDDGWTGIAEADEPSCCS